MNFAKVTVAEISESQDPDGVKLRHRLLLLTGINTLLSSPFLRMGPKVGPFRTSTLLVYYSVRIIFGPSRQFSKVPLWQHEAGFSE